MKTSMNTSLSTRAFAQVNPQALYLLGCLGIAPVSLCGTQRGDVVFSPCFVRDRRHALYPGGAIRVKHLHTSVPGADLLEKGIVP